MHQRTSLNCVVLLTTILAPWLVQEMTSFSLGDSVSRSEMADDCDGPVTTEVTAAESLKVRLPSVDWDEVVPGRILPVVNLSIDELRNRFGDEQSRAGLIDLLDDDQHWAVAHVILTALYRTEREDASTAQLRYRSKRSGRTMKVEYNGLALQIEYVDDGYCVNKTIHFPSRPALSDKWLGRRGDAGG